MVIVAMEEPSQLKRAIIDSSAGAISGGISRTVTSPLDVIKIRFQVQLEPTSSWDLLRKGLLTTAPSKYTGMLQASKDIIREEGLQVLQTNNPRFYFLTSGLFFLKIERNYLSRFTYLQGFWRGNVPALLMVMPYTAIQFTVLHKLKTFASGSSKTGILLCYSVAFFLVHQLSIITFKT